MVEGKPYRATSGTSSKNYGSQVKVITESDGLRYPRNLLSLPAGSNHGQHPTQKPVALMEYLIKTYTDEGMTVLDNCMGSGTTGVACKSLGRNFIGIELDPAYFAIAKERIAKA